VVGRQARRSCFASAIFPVVDARIRFPDTSPKYEQRREYIQNVSKLPKPPSRETVLLVEDDPAVRGVAQRSLSRLGYRVLSAEGGDSAMEVARGYAGPIELLLTDVMMPGKNGVEVAAAVQEVRPGIKVFFMSGYADQELIRQGLLSPRTHFLQKPFTPKELTGGSASRRSWPQRRADRRRAREPPLLLSVTAATPFRD
jgi:CheY-like chemotaxis protein